MELRNNIYYKLVYSNASSHWSSITWTFRWKGEPFHYGGWGGFFCSRILHNSFNPKHRQEIVFAKCSIFLLNISLHKFVSVLRAVQDIFFFKNTHTLPQKWNDRPLRYITHQTYFSLFKLFGHSDVFMITRRIESYRLMFWYMGNQ